jgi:integrase/recombinase XerD
MQISGQFWMQINTLEGYLDWCVTSDRASTTVAGKHSRLKRFNAWCLANKITTPKAITPRDLEAYRRHLYKGYVTRSGKPLDVVTRYGHLMDIKEYFRWMRRAGIVRDDPSIDLQLPRLPRRLRQVWLTPDESEQVLARAGRHGKTWLRDQAMLEVFFATGIRRKELIGLDISDINFEERVLKVRHGKAEYERYVPIAERACLAVQRYLRWMRPRLATFKSGDALFLDRDGNRFKPQRVSRFVKQFVARSGVPKRGACNLYRHGTAVLMLDNGADIRQVQEMLGHADISTTQVYAHVAIESLKRVYERTHPAARRRDRTVAKEPPVL